MFDRAIEQPARRVSAEYDASLGYPVSVDVDPRRDTFDGELRFRVTGVEILRRTPARS